MATLLLIETATSVCSTAIEHDGKIIAIEESTEPNAHSSKLSVLINVLLEKSGYTFSQLDGICVSSGPGSYTGLRIGVSTAKGLCYALDKPLLAIETLQNMASLYATMHSEYTGLICPMIDARRMEVYTALFDSKANLIHPTCAHIVTESFYASWVAEQLITFIGDGTEKTRVLLENKPNVCYDSLFRISASGMVALAETKYAAHQFEDMAYFQPFYLKDFVAAKSIIKGLK